jgi:hypothetical protein
MLPRKIFFAGNYLRQNRPSPFIMIYDRERTERSQVRLFKSRGQITCVQYGPYDNGHVLIGLSTGDFFAFDTVNLKKMCNIKLSDCPITHICIEWV